MADAPASQVPDTSRVPLGEIPASVLDAAAARVLPAGCPVLFNSSV